MPPRVLLLAPGIDARLVVVRSWFSYSVQRRFQEQPSTVHRALSYVQCSPIKCNETSLELPRVIPSPLRAKIPLALNLNKVSHIASYYGTGVRFSPLFETHVRLVCENAQSAWDQSDIDKGDPCCPRGPSEVLVAVVGHVCAPITLEAFIPSTVASCPSPIGIVGPKAYGEGIGRGRRGDTYSRAGQWLGPRTSLLESNLVSIWRH